MDEPVISTASFGLDDARSLVIVTDRKGRFIIVYRCCETCDGERLISMEIPVEHSKIFRHKPVLDDPES